MLADQGLVMDVRTDTCESCPWRSSFHCLCIVFEGYKLQGSKDVRVCCLTKYYFSLPPKFKEPKTGRSPWANTLRFIFTSLPLQKSSHIWQAFRCHLPSANSSMPRPKQTRDHATLIQCKTTCWATFPLHHMTMFQVSRFQINDSRL